MSFREDRTRILFLSDHLGHSGGRVHGATSYFLSVLPRVDQAAFELTVCFLRGRHESAEALEKAGIQPIFLNKGKWDFTAVSDIVRLIRERRANIVHASGMKGILAGCRAARLCRVKTIIHFHDMIPQPLPIRLLQMLIAPRADRALAISNAVGRFAVEHFRIRPDRVRTLYNGIELDRFAGLAPELKTAFKNSLGLPADAPVLIIIGRLDAVKNQAEALRVMREVVDKMPGARLLIVGAGPLEKELKTQARTLGLEENVLFLGQRFDVPELLGVSDLMIITSISEGLGVSAIEALAAGVPVVCPRTGGLAEVVAHENCGYLAEPGNTHELALGILDLLRDRERRAGFSKAAREQSRKFDIGRHVRLLEECYFELMGSDR